MKSATSMAKHGTEISWTHVPGYKGETWNPIVGCSKVSPACEHCYAERMAVRLAANPATSYYSDTIKNGKWSGRTVFVETLLSKPLKWKKPRAIFVGSMTDIFHETVEDEWLDRIFAVAAAAPQHIFIILTKRAERMAQYFSEWKKTYQEDRAGEHFYGQDIKINNRAEAVAEHSLSLGGATVEWKSPEQAAYVDWPLPNVWIGVTAEDQDQASQRIPWLLKSPAAKRVVSCEPLLGKIRLDFLDTNDEDDPLAYYDALRGRYYNGSGHINIEKLDWVICGGESGPAARVLDIGNVRNLRDQCVETGVPYFFKQWGETAPYFTDAAKKNFRMVKVGKKAAGRLLDGREYNDFPRDLNGLVK